MGVNKDKSYDLYPDIFTITFDTILRTKKIAAIKKMCNRRFRI